MALILVLNFSLSGAIQVFAHSAILEVGYDDCKADDEGDYIDEMWYALGGGETLKHLSHEETTIKYYFNNSSADGFYTWTSNGVSENLAKEIKNAYANSMKKWNNVYFYTYNSDGTVTRNRIVNIVPGTYEDHNLTIYPAWDIEGFAGTDSAGIKESIVENDGTTHYHFSQWNMTIDLKEFSEASEEAEVLRERTGAHEIGHILGLRDVDVFCTANNGVDHHHELLMGYGLPIADRMTDITYKDIVGAAITRGLHTDDDHQWIDCGKQSNGKYKWLCAICNGTKEALSTGSHPAYEGCGGNHALSSGYMMAVASYGTKDYYKCRYCRYVAPFDSIVEQNYVRTYVDSQQDRCYNNVTGLGYTTYAPHDYSYTRTSDTSHVVTCGCGYEAIAPHVVNRAELVNNRYGQCIDCGAIIDLGSTILPGGPLSTAKVSVNGSFILPNGIIVLVDADIEAYRNGTLVFYDIDDVPVTQ